MIRITGGRWRGRAIRAPAGERTRPTSSKIRGALFDMLQTEVEGARFADLFCGAGTIGLEALSRGAAEAIFVERSRPVLTLLRENLARLDVEGERAHVRGLPAERWARGSEKPADIVFCDPPYRSALLRSLLPTLAERKIRPGGWLVAETAKTADLDDLRLPGLALDRVRRHGDTALWLWRRE